METFFQEDDHLDFIYCEFYIIFFLQILHTMAISYFSFFLSITIFASISEGGYPPNEGYGGYEVKKYPYLPAPPGETPGCAKGGVTYCEKIDTYPM